MQVQNAFSVLCVMDTLCFPIRLLRRILLPFSDSLFQYSSFPRCKSTSSSERYSMRLLTLYSYSNPRVRFV